MYKCDEDLKRDCMFWVVLVS